MTEKNTCSGCGRQCDLEHPHCGRGEEYRRTGQMPEGHGHGHEHGHEHDHDHEHGHGHHHHHDCEMREAHYRAADINDKMIINLRDLGHMMRFQYEGKASQKRILIILEEVGTITQRDLTQRLGIQPGSASEILSKLESAGLIARVQNETDRRTTDICLTDTGRELAAQALAQRRKRHEEMFSCLSEEEKQELLSLLEKVCADWRERYCTGGRPCGNRHHDGHGPHGEHEHHGGHGHHGDEEGPGEHGFHRDHGYHEGHGHHGHHGNGGN